MYGWGVCDGMVWRSFRGISPRASLHPFLLTSMYGWGVLVGGGGVGVYGLISYTPGTPWGGVSCVSGGGGGGVGVLVWGVLSFVVSRFSRHFLYIAF